MPVLDSLVRTILSQNTTDKLSRQAFENLKKNYKDYLSILYAKDGEVGEN
jgi:endonuclease III